MHKIVTFLEKEKEKVSCICFCTSAGEGFVWILVFQGVTVFPPRDLIFNAFNLTPLNQIRVVLIGQDPYHDVGQVVCFLY